MKDQTNEVPKIELYMYSLNQEFPVSKGHATFLKRHSEVKPGPNQDLVTQTSLETQVFRTKLPSDWAVQWISNEWITNHTKAAGIGILEDVDPMLNIFIRQEDFGAIVFEPLSDRVFKLNHAGFSLLSDLIATYKKGAKNLNDFSSNQFDSGDVRNFVQYLKGAGIWMHD